MTPSATKRAIRKAAKRLLDAIDKSILVSREVEEARDKLAKLTDKSVLVTPSSWRDQP